MTQLPKYDLEDRTARFGENIIKFCKNLALNEFNRSLVSQIIRSATSIGANYMEANGASSPKDFRNKIYICKKESQETKHWLRMLAVTDVTKQEDLRIHWREAQELTLIFQRILMTLDGKNKKDELKIEN